MMTISPNSVDVDTTSYVQLDSGPLHASSVAKTGRCWLVRRVIFLVRSSHLYLRRQVEHSDSPGQVEGDSVSALLDRLDPRLAE
jgi:hypothetical protein